MKMHLYGLAVCLAVATSVANASSPSYYCYRTNKPIAIDGMLDEQAWKAVPGIAFYDSMLGTPPAGRSVAKMLWNNQYLYIGFELGDEDTDAASRGADANGPAMSRDQFVKVLIDPDSDGQNYQEFRISPLHDVSQRWFARQGTDQARGDQDAVPAVVHTDWICKGLKSAVHAGGTRGKAGDAGADWSVEIAVPWTSLKRFSKGACPPAAGNVWRAHLSRIRSKGTDADPVRWTWPVMGTADDGLPEQWGYVIFSGDPAVRKAAPPLPSPGAEPFDLKLVWVWSLENKPTAEIAGLARSLGCNALGWMLPDRTDLVDECHKAGMKVFGVVYFPSDPTDKQFGQVLLPGEEEWARKLQEGPLKGLGQGGGEPVIGGEIENQEFWCLDRPEAMEYAKRRIDQFIAGGYDGIAFDSIGYKNGYACFCPVSVARQEAYAAAHPGLSRRQALYQYSGQCLVTFLTALDEYARARKPGITTTCHIWPDFAPDPLYGNKIPVDYCGQTVTWFFPPIWADDKIERYIYEIGTNGGRYHRGSQGAPFLGLWYPSGKRPPEQVTEFIRLVKKSGARGIHLCELSSILSDPAVAQAVSEELGGNVPGK